ncbi:UNVERIFIED_CONTAM: hypothetical protein RKD50_001079 [Streptomyces canus]
MSLPAASLAADAAHKVSSPTGGCWKRLLLRVLRRMPWRAQNLRNSSLRSDSSPTVANSRVLVTGSRGGPQGGHGVHTAPDIAEAIAFSVTAPPNVNVAKMVVVPVRQG